MNKIEELEARLDAMQAELEKLKAADDKWPREGDEYWYFDSEGLLGVCAWLDDDVDNRRFSVGNAFHTKEEAAAELEARKVIAELRRQPGARRLVIGRDNWSFAYNAPTRTLNNSCWRNHPPFQQSVWFDTLESARAAVRAVGEERIIKAARWWALGEC